MHVHPLITDSATLANLCARLADAPFVCVDTEFMRENTYWPELCLIQIADTEEAAAIDPRRLDSICSRCSICWSITRTC
jgi:ribonuclease D